MFGWLPWVLKQILQVKMLGKWSPGCHQVVTKWSRSRSENNFFILKNVFGVYDDTETFQPNMIYKKAF